MFLYYKPHKKDKKVGKKTVEMSRNHIKIAQGLFGGSAVIEETHRSCDIHENEPSNESRSEDLVHVTEASYVCVYVTIMQASVLIIPASFILFSFNMFVKKKHL